MSERGVSASYSESVVYYDAVWSPIIRPVGRKLLEALPLDRAGRVLDVGTGTGAHIPDFRELAPRALVVGVDLTEEMLRAARVKHRAPVAAMDCMHLGLVSAAFDVAAMPFMLHYVADPPAALREVGRIVRPGGTIGTATWAGDPSYPAQDVWEEELKAAGAGDDPIAVPDYLELMDSPDKVEAAMTDGGLEPVRIWVADHAHTWPPEDYLTYLSYGARRRRLETLPPEAREEVMRRVRARLDALDPEGWIFRFSIVLAVARRP